MDNFSVWIRGRCVLQRWWDTSSKFWGHLSAINFPSLSPTFPVESFHHPYNPWEWYIYLHERLQFRVHLRYIYQSHGSYMGSPFCSDRFFSSLLFPTRAGISPQKPSLETPPPPPNRSTPSRDDSLRCFESEVHRLEWSNVSNLRGLVGRFRCGKAQVVNVILF